MFERLMPNSENTTTVSSESRRSSSETVSGKSTVDSASDIVLSFSGRDGNGLSPIAGAEEVDCNDPNMLKSIIRVMMFSLQTRDDTIASLEKKFATKQTEASSFREKVIALTSENTHFRKELAASRARGEALEKNLEQITRKQMVLEDAEERLCAQLADLEAETLEQNRQHKAELRKLNSELQQKEALVNSLAADTERYRRSHEASGTDTVGYDSSLAQLSDAKSQLDSLQRKHWEALATLTTARSEIAELKSVIDTLKAEMLSLDSANRTQANLLKNAQKELESFKRRNYAIQVEALEILFNFKSPSTLLVGSA